MFTSKFRKAKQIAQPLIIVFVVFNVVQHVYYNARQVADGHVEHLYSCLSFAVTADTPRFVYAPASIFYNTADAVDGVKLYDGTSGQFDEENYLSAEAIRKFDFDNTQIFFITHGNSDSLVNDKGVYNLIAQRIVNQLRNSNHSPALSYKIIGIDWSNGAHKAMSIPHAKTACHNENGENILMAVGRTVMQKLDKGQVDCSNVVMIGHSFGNGVNYEVSKNLCKPSTLPGAVVLNPANRYSGIHIHNYADAFRDEGSIAVYTDSLFDESVYIGLTHRHHLTEVAYAWLLPFQAHESGRVWFASQLAQPDLLTLHAPIDFTTQPEEVLTVSTAFRSRPSS